MRRPGRGVLAVLLLAGACTLPDAHVPDFARRPYEPFAREAAIAIALREWRAFGQPVDDAPPGSLTLEAKPERLPGLWQRVGEYWWLGLDADRREHRWTGRHDENGVVFPPELDGEFAWSAAFISYVMRMAGAGPGFPYSESHADYINLGREAALGRRAGLVVMTEPPEAYAPVAGDLVCHTRGSARSLSFAELPTGRFPSHCDIVVAAAPRSLTVIGGNVDDAVVLKHVPLTADGRLVGPDGVPVDSRYPWFAVLRILYRR